MFGVPWTASLQARIFFEGKSVMIEVRRVFDGDPMRFDVVVRDGAGQTRHDVTMSRKTYERLSGGAFTPEQCIDAAFRFLLEREPKEAILKRFDVTLVSRYFGEFEQELPRYLAPR